VIAGENSFELVVAGNVTEGLDGTYTIAPPEGYWNIGTGYVTSATAATALANKTNLDDLRYWLLQNFPAGLVTGIEFNPTSLKLKLYFATSDGTVTIGAGTTFLDLGYLVGQSTNVAVSAELEASNMADLSQPRALVLSTSDFASASTFFSTDTKNVARTGSYFETIPITSAFGSQQVYEPYNQTTRKTQGGQSHRIRAFKIEVRDAETGTLLTSMSKDYSLVLELQINQYN
jgi:hypothetical protein